MPHRQFEAPRSPAWLARAQAWLAEPSEGVEPRDAATVQIVRDTEEGLEVFVQRRVSSMAFAPSMYVFPGGAVDPADFSEVPSPAGARLSAAMGCDASRATSVVAAALREVHEECGLVLDADTFALRAHWVTPPFEARRYDTWFFAAALPAGQAAHGDSGESDLDAWVRPSDLLAAVSDGEAAMLPPTIVVLEQLAGFASVAELLADSPRVQIVMPELVDLGDRLVLRAQV